MQLHEIAYELGKRLPKRLYTVSTGSEGTVTVSWESVTNENWEAHMLDEVRKAANELSIGEGCYSLGDGHSFVKFQ